MIKERKHNFIYKITNLKTNEYYIGMHSTDNLDDGYMGSGEHIKKSIKKYGIDSFTKDILYKLNDRKSLANKEAELITEELLKDPLCLNIGLGGGGGLKNEEHLKKMNKGSSKFQKEKWENEEYRNKISQVLRNNMRENHKNGKIRYDTTLGYKWITNGTQIKLLKKNETLPDGWMFGKKIK